MRLRLIVALTLITCLVSLASVLQSRATVKAIASAGQKTSGVQRKPIQPDLPGTVSGANNPEAIPDTVAFELFMRSIADYPSENVFRDAGLHGDQIRNALSYVQSFELAMSLFDQEARMIKGSRRGMDKLPQLQKKKEEYLERGMNHYLPMVLGEDGGSKIRSYINARVKPKTKKVPVSNARQNKLDNNPKDAARYKSGDMRAARHHAPVPGISGGGYVYCNGWIDGQNVYGSGTISSDYSDFNQYLVTTTVVAPNGSRWSSSQTGWDYSAVTDTEYLPTWPNDGTFTVEAVFEGTNGYFSSAMNAVVVAPQISVSGAVAVPALVNVDGSVEITALISFTQGVPAGATALIELNETVNFNAINYNVGEPRGVDTVGTNKRSVTLVALPAGVKPITWPLTNISAGSGVWAWDVFFVAQ